MQSQPVRLRSFPIHSNSTSPRGSVRGNSRRNTTGFPFHRTHVWFRETFEGLEFDLTLGLIRRVAVENGVNILKTKLEGMFATQIRDIVHQIETAFRTTLRGATSVRPSGSRSPGQVNRLGCLSNENHSRELVLGTGVVADCKESVIERL